MNAYLITGVAGFVGYHLATSLIQQGHCVVGIDSLDDCYDIRLKQWRLGQLAQHRSFWFEHIDISREDGIARISEATNKQRFLAVIHLAARSGIAQSLSNPRACLETNILGTATMLEWCRVRQVPRFVLASSSSVYGKPLNHPCQETDDANHPLSPYAASKKAAEVLCHSYHVLHQIHVGVLRFFTVFGPAGRPDMCLFRFVKWIIEGQQAIVHGEGLQRRDFTFVDDIVRGITASLSVSGFAVVNLGSGYPVTLRHSIGLIEEITGRSALVKYQPRRPGDADLSWADNTRAGDLFGWRPRISHREGLEQMVRWYRDNQYWAKHLIIAD